MEHSKILDDLLVNYDKRFIPTLPGYPLKVDIQLVISEVFNLDDSNRDLEMLLYIRQRWFDYRLSWNSTDVSRIKVREHLLHKIWIPDIRIRNLKDAKRFHDFGGVNMNLHSNGKIYFSQLSLVKIACPMDLRKFPMDEQTCQLHFSSYAYAKSLLQFSLTDKTVVKSFNLPQFDYVGTSRIVNMDREDIIPKITITLKFQRRSGYYILQIYIPSLFLVLLSWLSFFMQATDIANRLALEVTMVLSIVFLLGNSNTSLPHLSYAKASDVFIIVSFGFIFMALLQTMLTYHLTRQKGLLKHGVGKKSTSFSALTRFKERFLVYLPVFKKKGKAESKSEQYELEENEFTGCTEPLKTDVVFEPASEELPGEISRFWLDQLCIIAFPTLYIIFNALYWWYYL